MKTPHPAPLASRTFLRWQTSDDARLAVVTAEMGEQGLPPHFHDMWSVGVVVEGDCRFRTLPHGKDLWHLAPAGSVFVLRPYETHACGAGIGGYRVRYALVYVDAAEMCRLAPRLAALHSADSRRVWPVGMPFVEQLLTVDSAGAARTWLQAVEARVLPSASGAEVPHGPAEPQLHGLQAWLHQHWQESSALEQGKQQMPASPWHSIRTFRQQVGLTPSAYLRQYRLQQSRRWLAAPDGGLPLAELAAMLGFADQAHFTRAFKQVYGVTPGQWRAVAQTLPAQ